MGNYCWMEPHKSSLPSSQDHPGPNHPRQVTVPLALQNVQAWRHHDSSRQLAPMPEHPQSQKVPPLLQPKIPLLQLQATAPSYATTAREKTSSLSSL